MYYVYLLKSIHFADQTYIGCTTNVSNRLKVHNSGGSPHTSKYKPWILHGYFAFSDQQKAFNFEHYLKSHSGQAFAKKRLW